MHALTRRGLSLLVLCSLCVAVLRAGHYQNFRTAVYVRAYEVQKMKDPEWLKANWDVIERQLKVDKIYLETHRDLIVIDDATLQAAKRFFEQKGIQPAAGIAYVRNERNLFETFCYTKPDHRAKVKEIIEVSARNFDEVILDDFFFTSCKCEECIRAKGDRTWAEYRMALLTEVSRELIAAARAVNPQVKLTIKYPNWYEHFHGMGYNLEAQPRMFDKIYTGTETRDSRYNHQHLQPYQSFQQVRYFENIKPGGNLGGWVDTGNRIVADRYAEQLWLTMFAKAPEIMLFALHELLEPLTKEDRAPWQGQGTSFDYDTIAQPVPGLKETTMARAAGVSLEQVDRYLGKLGRPVGIASYRPYHSSTQEDFLHNYLGGIGLPIDLHPEFPSDAPLVLLTEGAAADPQIVTKIKTHLLSGKDVVITSGLLREIQDQGFRRDIADVRCTEHKALTREFWGWPLGRGVRAVMDRDILIPELRYNTNDSWELVASMTNGLGYPLAHYVPYANAKLYVLTMPENFGDLYELPAPVLNFIRQTASKGLFARLEAPARIALLPYDNRALVVESFRDEPAEVRIVTGPEIKQLKNEITGELVVGTLEKGGGFRMPAEERMIFTTRVKPHSFVVFTSQ
ncbi:hypothetical protein [Opitutus terrae]|uniref:Permease n=1 Tax=Opitutus terrae (strain DSM 11246 / JCM 15787 / PB90-1) TaxID=452637 RepID=B1ZS07_OPITP|nr:hypothetical protein [Opitutus terrae]ACB74683.1 conserved hypothetical protein [Opitutus terrae PB90-1]